MRRDLAPRLLLTLFALGIGISTTASAAVKDRITSSVSESVPVAIPNSVHPRVRLATDLGPAPDSMKIEQMTLRFSMTAAQQAALDQLLIDQQDPSSPQYHQWLTPAQYGAQFGLSSGDIAKVTAWLTSQGFTVTEVANSSTFVQFNGTAAQVDAAFSTSIHNVSYNGETHFANITDASVPSAFADIVLGITGLHDFRLKPRIHTQVVRPDYTNSVTGAHYVEPGDFYKIYGEIPLFTGGITGSGVTIAVMGQVDLYNTGTTTAPVYADIAAFRAAAGLSVNQPTVKTFGTDPGNPKCNVYCTPSESDLGESSLDVEWAGAIAPGATILFVNGADVFVNSMTQAVDQNVAPILTISYGDCEPAWGTSNLNLYNQLFKQANAQGQTIVAPAGDEGATDCDAGPSATSGLAVDFPASSPYVTGMGGTQFNEGSTNYWLTANGTVTAGTVLTGATYSAMSYIPEAVWNDYSLVAEFGGSGGGVSVEFAKPYWQVGTGVPADASRDVPDLSLDSSDVHDGLLYCLNGSCASGFTGAISAGTIAGGTSFATPTFAGILALIEQKTGSHIANANPTIYALAKNSTYYQTGANIISSSGVVFNDITTGNNSSPCTQGSFNCPSGGSIGYSAGSGYDLATGWGSVNVGNLVNDWSLVTPIVVSGPAGTNASLTVVTVSSATVAAPNSVTLTATVTGAASSTPTGTVQFLVNNVEVGSPATLNSSGVATYSWTTSCSTLGQQIISAAYSGDATYLGSKGAGVIAGNTATAVTPVTVQVSSGTCPSFSVSGPTSSVSVASASTPTATITVASLNSFAGTVVLSATATENTSYAPGFTFSPSSVALTASGSGASQNVTLTLTGITAKLHAPAVPGKLDPGIQLAQQSTHRKPWYAAGSGVAIASLLLLTLPRRRRLGGLLLVLLSIAIVGGATGCGGANNSAIKATTSDQYAGTYVVTVVGTYTSGSTVITQTASPVTFVIQ